MRDVNRPKCPASLLKNQDTWKKALLEKIKDCKKINSKVPESYYNKYKKKDIKACLVNMYSSLCCYCEGEIGLFEYGNIEHRLPKSIFPELCYDWENLHLSCTFCNDQKSNQVDEINPILDAIKDKPIDIHLDYEWGLEGLLRIPLTDRGKTTINFADLNRNSMQLARINILRETFNIILEIKSNPTSPSNEIKMNELKIKTNAQFGTVIKWALKNLK